MNNEINFGIGFIRNQRINGLAQIGVNNKLFIDDIGLVGCLAQFGILALVLQIKWIYEMVLKLKKYKQPLYIAIFAYILGIIPFDCLLNMDNGIVLVFIVLIMVDKNTIFLDEKNNNKLG